MRQTGICCIASPRTVMDTCVQRRERCLSGAQRPCERVCSQRRHEVCASGCQPRLRPAEQLVTGEEHQVGARREALLRHRLVPDAELRGVQ